MSIKNRTFITFLFYLSSLISVCEISASEKEWVVHKTLELTEKTMQDGELSVRQQVIKDTLFSLELSLEGRFGQQGRQIFEVVIDDERRLSRLEYPLRGEVFTIGGELGHSSGFSLGGTFGSSNLRKNICSDEDWGFYGWHNSEYKYIDYQITNQDSTSAIEFFDANLYYTLLDMEKRSKHQEHPLFKEQTLFDDFLIDDWSLDVFVGYQYYKGRYRMIDPMKETFRIVDGSWWEGIGYPADLGLDSFYKVRYKGPRVGVRLNSTAGKAQSRLSLSLAWLKTNAYGWWNLREYSFWHTGSRGYGVNIGFDVVYPLTPSLFAGIGYHYLYFHQDKLIASGVYYSSPSSNYFDYDIIRNVDLKIYGPSFIIKYMW